MAESPKRDGSNGWSDSDASPGLKEREGVDSSFNSTNATSPVQEDDHASPSLPDDETDRSPALSPGAAGEQLGDWLSDAGSSRNASVTAYSPGSHAEEAQASSPRPGPSRILKLPEETSEQAQTHVSIADRRGKAPLPVRFAESNVKTKAKTIPALDTVNNDASTTSSANHTGTAMVNILTKIQLLPALVALRASARPGADPEDTHKALEQAKKARAFAQQHGASTALLGQCSYYTAIANFAVGQEDQDKTLALFAEAREAKGLTAEGDWADRWITYVQEQERLDRDSDTYSMTSRPNSFLGAFLDPIATMLGASRLSWSSSKAPATGRRRNRPAGLYAQMAPARREVLATKPAAKRMPIWSDSDSSAALPSRPLPNYKDSLNRLPSWGSSSSPVRPPPRKEDPWAGGFSAWNTSTSRSSGPSSSYIIGPSPPLSALPLRAAGKRDSQGNFEHLNTGLKYNEEHPFGLDVEFVESPESYEVGEKAKWSPPGKQDGNNNPPTHPPVRRYYIVNPDPSDPSSSSASARAVKTATMSSSEAGFGAALSSMGTTSSAGGEEVTQPRRKGSWISRKLSLATPDRETGSPTKSLEAMVEEGESPGFKPEGWGKLLGGKKG